MTQMTYNVCIRLVQLGFLDVNSLPRIESKATWCNGKRLFQIDLGLNSSPATSRRVPGYDH